MKKRNYRRRKENMTPYILGQQPKKPNLPPTREDVSKQIEKQSDRRKIFVWVNTYNRCKEFGNLLKDIYQNKGNHDLKILVVDDGSDVDYENVLSKYDGKLNIEFHSMSENHGKKYYWKLCNYAMQQIKRNSGYHYYVKLDDDGRLENRFFDRCINVWESINDPRKICLNFRLDNREGKKVWTGFKPKKFVYNNIPVYLSQWVDMDFFVTENFFRILQYQIRPQHLNRFKNPYVSSGVGKDISNRLVKRGYHLYLTTQSLVKHTDHDSKMNPLERQRNSLETKPFTDKKYGL
jgi:hypothetical protein